MANPSNVTYAVFGADRTANAETIYQYAYGQILRFVDIDLPQSYEVHFARQGASGDAIPQIGGTNGVRIPDSLLTKSGTIMAYIVLHAGESDGATEYVVKIPVEARPKAADTTPTPQDQSVITQAMAVLQEAVEGHEGLVADVASLEEAARDRVASLDTTPLVTGHVVEAADIPEYVSDVSQYSAYGLTDTGWYVFARISAPTGVTVGADTEITGAAGCIAEVGADHVDVAVRFGVCAESVPVTISWGSASDTYVFTAPGLAIRNLDYRTTFYVYDATAFATWTWALTTDATFSPTKNYYTLADGVYTKAPESAKYTLTADETFQDGKTYYTEASGVYTAATVTTGEAVAADTYYELATVPADTYYTHSKITFAGMARNITYRFNETIDCPMEFILPAIEDETYGCWFELRLKLNGTYSMTLTLQDSSVKIATEHTQSEQAGFNTIDLHYSVIDGEKLWRFLNTRSTIPST